MSGDSPRVAVTGVGSNIGQGVVKALRLAYPEAYVVGTDAKPRSVGFFACDAGEVLPHSRLPEYGERVRELLERHAIDLLLIASHAETLPLSRLRGELEEGTGAKVVVSSTATVEAAIDKYRTVEVLAAAGCNAPCSTVSRERAELEAFAAAVGFPLIVKPRGGQGSRGVSLVDDLPSLVAAWQAEPEALVQEHVGDLGQEYTAAAWTDRDGELKGVVTMRRELDAGTTVLAEFGAFPRVRREVERVVAALEPRGPINVQLRLAERGAVTFEVNPRFSGTTALRALAGWNDVAATVDSFHYGRPAELPAVESGSVLRYYDEVFVGADELRTVEESGRWSSAAGPRRSLALFDR